MKDFANLSIKPEFDDSIFAKLISDHATELARVERIPARDIFQKLLDQIDKIDFVSLAGVEDKSKLTNAHYRILAIENILKLAHKNSWGLCRNLDFIYGFNGCHWFWIDQSVLKYFLGLAAERMGVPWEKSKDYGFQKGLYEQFLVSAHFEIPERKDSVLIPLTNGTFEITREGLRVLKDFNRNDFLTYQLPFAYDPQATAPMFYKFLNEVLPDVDRQLVLCEFIGYLFTRGLKLEKALILYGQGANGKSVTFDIIYALLGGNNISNYSLSSLTDGSGYYRAMLANKLCNYASEINGKLEASLFKQLVSGEPIEARLPYGTPMIISDYAKLIFNANELPHDVEHTHAFFRRFLIIPFDISIPESQQDKDLAKKIIESELPGIFNWVLSGLDRILSKKSFTPCEAIRKQLENYRKQSDSVAMFLEDEGYQKSPTNHIPLKELYARFRSYCIDSGYRTPSIKTLRERLTHVGFDTQKRNYGIIVFASKSDASDASDGRNNISI